MRAEELESFVMDLGANSKDEAYVQTLIKTKET